MKRYVRAVLPLHFLFSKKTWALRNSMKVVSTSQLCLHFRFSLVCTFAWSQAGPQILPLLVRNKAGPGTPITGIGSSGYNTPRCSVLPLASGVSLGKPHIQMTAVTVLIPL